MKHIIVLPYWCDKEVANFMQVVGRWEMFCRSEVEYSFVVARRFDAEESVELVGACSKHAPTKSIVCDRYRWDGWPGGANGMFRHVMEVVKESEDKDGGFVFWFEHDVIPIYLNWLHWLDRMWSPELSMMGQYMSPPWINLHRLPMPPNINGTACYSKDLADGPSLSEVGRESPFDYILKDALPRHGRKSLALPLLQDLWFFMPDWVERCDLTKLMVNGIKEINQRERVIQYILRNRD